MARILVSGATGLIGKAFTARRVAAGDTVVALTRGADGIQWEPESAVPLDPALVSGFDAVVHLAGESVGTGRWTAEKKRRIMDSRALGTRKLAAALAAADAPPRVFLCASGINVYGDCGDRVIDEATPSGAGFLADVCRAWEGACTPLAGVCRVVNMRIGVVLAGDGGTLATMLPLFRLGLGGAVGGGTAYMSWVALEDLLRGFDFLLAADGLSGPVNLIAPNPVTGKEFTAALGKAVGKPAFLPVPAFAARIAFGEMVDETVLASVRAVPRRLREASFVFAHPEIGEALTASGVHP